MSVQESTFLSKAKLMQRDKFKHLGSLISSHGSNSTEIATRKTKAKISSQAMKIRTNKYINLHRHKKKRPWRAILNPF